MEYFILEQDTRTHNTIHLPIIQYMRINDAKQLNLTSLPPLIVEVRKGSRFEEYPDLLSQQLFLVRESLQEVIKLFLPRAEYKRICFFDQYKNSEFHYYAYPLPIVDSLSSQSRKIGRGNRIEKVVLKQNAIGDLDIVKVAGVESHLILVSLPVAEAILRRKLKGIRLLETSFEKES